MNLGQKPESIEKILEENLELKKTIEEQKKGFLESSKIQIELSLKLNEAEKLIADLKTENFALKEYNNKNLKNLLSVDSLNFKKGIVASESETLKVLSFQESSRLKNMPNDEFISNQYVKNTDCKNSVKKELENIKIAAEFVKNDSEYLSPEKTLFEINNLEIKMPVSPRSVQSENKEAFLSSKVESPKQDYSKLFENFYIIGYKRTDEFQPGEIPELNILFSLYPTDRLEDDQKEQLSKFVNPFCQKFKMKKIKNKGANLCDVIFQEEISNKFLDFFPIALAGEDSKRPGQQQRPHLLPYSPTFQVDHEILRECNPDGFHFYYCLKINDDFLTRDYSENSGLNVYTIPRFYVLKTFYPFSRFFQDYLQQISVLIRSKRREKFLECVPDAALLFTTSSILETSLNISVEVETVIAELEKLNCFSISNNFEEKITINFGNTARIDYYLPGIKNATFSEAEFGFGKILSLLPFEDFLFILFSILSEKSVIFVSENQHYLSASVSTFLALLRPFKWVFPVIYSLPENCLLMLSTPLPLMLGLNTSIVKVLTEVIPEIEEKFNCTVSNNIYVFLDHGLYYYDFEGIDSVLIPQFDEFIEKMEKIYKKSFNNKSSNFFKMNKVKKNKSVYNFVKKTNTSKLREKLGRVEIGSDGIGMLDKNKTEPVSEIFDSQIFYFMRYFFNAFMISKLPCDRNLSHFGRETKIKEIDVAFFSTNTSDVEFLEDFMKTQIFMYYLENDFFGISNAI